MKGNLLNSITNLFYVDAHLDTETSVLRLVYVKIWNLLSLLYLTP